MYDLRQEERFILITILVIQATIIGRNFIPVTKGRHWTD